MATIQPDNPPIDYNLDQLNQYVAQQEGVLGPLASIGNAAGKSVLGFDLDQRPPATNAVLAEGDAPDGAVCSGKLYVSGTLTSVYATL